MPAKSEKQRKAAGAALAAKRDGDCSRLPKGSSSRRMCESMTKKELAEFASKENDNTSNTQKGRKFNVLHRD